MTFIIQNIFDFIIMIAYVFVFLCIPILVYIGYTVYKMIGKREELLYSKYPFRHPSENYLNSFLPKNEVDIV